MSTFTWQLRDRLLHFDQRPLIMGIVNVTPDSFADGGRHSTTEQAIAHGLQLVEEGADLLDIGGESSRPAPFPSPRTRSCGASCPWCASWPGLTSLPFERRYDQGGSGPPDPGSGGPGDQRHYRRCRATPPWQASFAIMGPALS